MEANTEHKTMLKSQTIQTYLVAEKSDTIRKALLEKPLLKQVLAQLTKLFKYMESPGDLPWRKTTGMCLPGQNFMTLSWNEMLET